MWAEPVPEPVDEVRPQLVHPREDTHGPFVVPVRLRDVVRV